MTMRLSRRGVVKLTPNSSMVMMDGDRAFVRVFVDKALGCPQDYVSVWVIEQLSPGGFLREITIALNKSIAHEVEPENLRVLMVGRGIDKTNKNKVAEKTMEDETPWAALKTFGKHKGFQFTVQPSDIPIMIRNVKSRALSSPNLMSLIDRFAPEKPSPTPPSPLAQTKKPMSRPKMAPPPVPGGSTSPRKRESNAGSDVLDEDGISIQPGTDFLSTRRQVQESSASTEKEAAARKKEEEEAAAARKKKEDEEAAARKKKEEEEAERKRKEAAEAAERIRRESDVAERKRLEEAEEARKKQEAEREAARKKEEEAEREAAREKEAAQRKEEADRKDKQEDRAQEEEKKAPVASAPKKVQRSMSSSNLRRTAITTSIQKQDTTYTPPSCPKCLSDNVAYRYNNRQYFCLDCLNYFPGMAPPKAGAFPTSDKNYLVPASPLPERRDLVSSKPLELLQRVQAMDSGDEAKSPPMSPASKAVSPRGANAAFTQSVKIIPTEEKKKTPLAPHGRGGVAATAVLFGKTVLETAQAQEIDQDKEIAGHIAAQEVEAEKHRSKVRELEASDSDLSDSDSEGGSKTPRDRGRRKLSYASNPKTSATVVEVQGGAKQKVLRVFVDKAFDTGREYLSIKLEDDMDYDVFMGKCMTMINRGDKQFSVDDASLLYTAKGADLVMESTDTPGAIFRDWGRQDDFRFFLKRVVAAGNESSSAGSVQVGSKRKQFARVYVDDKLGSGLEYVSVMLDDDMDFGGFVDKIVGGLKKSGKSFGKDDIVVLYSGRDKEHKMAADQRPMAIYGEWAAVPNFKFLVKPALDAGIVFDDFLAASDYPAVKANWEKTIKILGLKDEPFSSLYDGLCARLTSWKCQRLWKLLNAKRKNPIYDGRPCRNLRVLITGAGPAGLRFAVEAALLGAEVVVVEKRDAFSRNNVLHLWQFSIVDLHSVGGKIFYPQFCAGGLNHIGIRRAQTLLAKVCLCLGVKIYDQTTFDGLAGPGATSDGYRVNISPADSPAARFEPNVIIAASGTTNTFPGLPRKEFRGKLSIGVTANWVNTHSKIESATKEIAGLAYVYKQHWFDKLNELHGIKLENIVYYKDATHYLVTTVKKESLLARGVLLKDSSDPAELLSRSNRNMDALYKLARDVAEYSTKLPASVLDNFAPNAHGKPDVDCFDFTKIYASSHAGKIIEQDGHSCFVALIGDALIEPFWPTGTGYNRSVLGVLDTAHAMVEYARINRSFPKMGGASKERRSAMVKMLNDRENVYHILPQTNPNNLKRNFDKYTIDPRTRYSAIPSQELDVEHLFECT